MANFDILCLAFWISLVIFHSSLVEGSLLKSMHFSWGTQQSRFLGDGDEATLILDEVSGSGIQSNESFLYGSFEMLIKLVPENSAGTVTAYYLSSTGAWDKHDEIDFEFLGNVSGQPYIIHTNIYTQGGGGREQQFYPWFDPTADYHNYTIHWTPSRVVWYVDSIPIRVFKNYQSEGIPYPNKRAMRVHASIWNADSWATRGGLDKIDWSNAPFVARLRHFRERACKYMGPQSIRQCGAPTPANWWSSVAYTQLSDDKLTKLNWVRNNHMIYDYCKDLRKYKGLMPGECFMPQR
ncbi:Xyloglucan:xyloglucosyl transferase [Handroanthus impetiginosus]|uniref:Xyloglucan endotransglucosylase/hydrolase n=1 Tax=Handroanthus impetiginosus TaxID=429701 RepID=A0A2G9G6W1_9LAMI|nr:Xyloglucan:xyloglucosyl transferase [Handroanthus impetiginosus]